MYSLNFRLFNRLRQSYWFWPSVMTFGAIALGAILTEVDALVGLEWTEGALFVHASSADGARAILTTLASATLGVAGVAFSITIVAVSFASSNYGPRLIGNFMADRVNQLVLGVFVATFAYCITVLITVRNSTTVSSVEIDAFVPQLSMYFALFLGLLCIASLIAYIHHIPESINIMNLTERIGVELRNSVIAMLDADDDAAEGLVDARDIVAWQRTEADAGPARLLRAASPGYLQHFDVRRIGEAARERGVQIMIEHAPGDFVAGREILMSVRPADKAGDDLIQILEKCYTLGAGRTTVQDILFLSDQLVEVLMRALSPGVNDPHTANLCLDWLKAGLCAFACREPSRPVGRDEPVLYGRVTFELMLDRSFDRMRPHIATERTVSLHAIGVLADIAVASSQAERVEMCRRQMARIAKSVQDVQQDTLSREEIMRCVDDWSKDLASRRRRELPA